MWVITDVAMLRPRWLVKMACTAGNPWLEIDSIIRINPHSVRVVHVRDKPWVGGRGIIHAYVWSTANKGHQDPVTGRLAFVLW